MVGATGFEPATPCAQDTFSAFSCDFLHFPISAVTPCCVLGFDVRGRRAVAREAPSRVLPRCYPRRALRCETGSRRSWPSQNLTVRSIEALKPRTHAIRSVRCADAGPRDPRDAERAQVVGALYRHHGRLRRLTLGRYPDRALAEARKEATARSAAVSSMAPTLPRRSKTSARRTATPSARSTSLYKKATEKKRSWPEQRRIFENEVLPAWRHRRVQDITRRDIRMLVDRKAETAPIMANRILARISRLFSFAVERDWIEANPALRIVKPGRREEPRSRAVSRRAAGALDGAASDRSQGRERQVAAAALADAERRVHRDAADRTAVRRGVPNAVAGGGPGDRLVDDSRGRLEESRPAPCAADGTGSRVLERRRFGADDRYVFSNHRHTCVSARAKKAASTLSKGLSFEFRAHDLRRTAASFMGEAGVDRFHIAHVLNHRSVTHSTVTAIYDRYRYDKEKRAALETWAKLLECIVEALSHVRENSESMA